MVMYLSLALGCMSAWMVPNIGIEIALYRVALTKHHHRGKHPDFTVQQANARITYTATVVISVCMSIYIVTAVAVALTTQNLDDRAISILDGLSYLTSCIAIFLISIETPMWLGVYYSSKTRYGPPVMIGTTLTQLTWNMAGRITRVFVRGYVLTSTFYCGVKPLTIPISVGIGILVGQCIFAGVYIGRTRWKQSKVAIALSLSVILSIFSAYCFGRGVAYIQDVWGKVPWQRRISKLAVWAFGIGLMCSSTAHCVVWRYSQHMWNKIVPSTSRQSSLRFQTQLFSPHLFRIIQEEYAQRSSSVRTVQVNESLALVALEHDLASTEYGSVPAQAADTDDADIPDSAEQSPKEPCLQKIVALFRWVAWIFVNLFFFFVIVVNIGASTQISVVMAQLPSSYAFLYPADYNTGAVCAWDQPGPDATIQTFDTPTAAYAANFSIVHCGACGECSTWNDLTLQWTTRHDLELRSQRCAKQSLFGGGVDAVQMCNRDQIGFTDQCAWCWTNDELCAKQHCIFVFLQGIIINKLTNFSVGPTDITSATCDEAMCGPVFAPCSGAIRRRMDIQSSIARSAYQECKIIEQDWATVFNHP